MAVESCGDIHTLPEYCIANALSLTSPKDACRLSAVASTFRSASQSDTVWDRFLPSDYREIISRAEGGPDSLLGNFRSKKDLYLHLCDNPILIDDGRKSFSLEKLSGKKCYMLAARELFIVWGDTPQYWQWISLSESRFPEVAELPLPKPRFSEVAELISVCWLEITGKISTDMLSPNTNYAAYLVFTCKSRGAYGFDFQPAEGSVSVSGHENEKRSICLDPEGERRQRYQIVPRHMGLFYHRVAFVQRQHRENAAMDQNTQYPKKRDDGWMEVELGEYFVKEGEDGDLEMSLMEVKAGNWKSGIIIQGIEIRPKEHCK
ncbi:hypothetical protein CDL12_26011 [Handroanthus impetiginosus]|uniref:F-box domain-containing protein n=1 Tax=Handroanthus impetiginosus TaxID=429701 RepID=A0A2G9G855_9LAMI|nr:hypothetical protein CDL12_26011 [Handroanthus impetiginosus]